MPVMNSALDDGCGDSALLDAPQRRRRSDRYEALREAERVQLHRLLALAPLCLRRLLPRRLRQRLYDWRLSASRRVPRPGEEEITPEDFRIAETPFAMALDLIAVCDLG